jgi:hypothetical protein
MPLSFIRQSLIEHTNKEKRLIEEGIIPDPRKAALSSQPPHLESSQNNKRKSTSDDPPNPEASPNDDICRHVNISCDAVRTKIRSFLNSGKMNVANFQKAFNANSKSYSSFMGQKGPHKGSNSNIYPNAFAFFKARELNGAKPLKKKIKPEDAEKTFDVSGITLEGEET